ncbi:hypothetical protein JW711_04975 [Candidatus Woesearchaeota archaeon]|nr:hypothetical protein [Candidatus Woesearchaeota archaeon]
MKIEEIITDAVTEGLPGMLTGFAAWFAHSVQMLRLLEKAGVYEMLYNPTFSMQAMEAAMSDYNRIILMQTLAGASLFYMTAFITGKAVRYISSKPKSQTQNEGRRP